jgi:hypothetical protein
VRKHRKTAGLWLIVHEHGAASFDMMTGTTLFGLEP